MFAVFEKEIKSLFRSIKNIIIAIVFAVFVGFCFVLGNLSNAKL